MRIFGILAIVVILLIILPKKNLGTFAKWILIGLAIIIGLIALTPFLAVAVVIALIIGIIYIILAARKKLHGGDE
ncbi:hypothetical protein C6P12_02075 [Weissella confusa]|nr:hypothetical protein C6P22_02090 [Weissella confusa]TGE65942.1 hypothetical protein C6P12_02075 [Weissella confusa]COJ11549.1 Uncharacterised protein [Streptococcus pneumoniae]